MAQWLRICMSDSRGEFDPWFGKIPQRRKWQLTPVFLPGKFHRQRSLTGYSSRGQKRVRHNLTSQLNTHNLTRNLITTICPDIILGYTCLLFFFFKRRPFPGSSPNYPLLSLLEYYSSSLFLSLNIFQGTIWLFLHFLQDKIIFSLLFIFILFIYF